MSGPERLDGTLRFQSDRDLIGSRGSTTDSQHVERQPRPTLRIEDGASWAATRDQELRRSRS